MSLNFLLFFLSFNVTIFKSYIRTYVTLKPGKLKGVSFFISFLTPGSAQSCQEHAKPRLVLAHAANGRTHSAIQCRVYRAPTRQLYTEAFLPTELRSLRPTNKKGTGAAE